MIHELNHMTTGCSIGRKVREFMDYCTSLKYPSYWYEVNQLRQVCLLPTPAFIVRPQAYFSLSWTECSSCYLSPCVTDGRPSQQLWRCCWYTQRKQRCRQEVLCQCEEGYYRLLYSAPEAQWAIERASASASFVQMCSGGGSGWGTLCVPVVSFLK